MGLRAKVKQMGLPLEQRLLMEGNITRLINDMGACENIFATPIPVGYTKHTSRFLFIWLFFLPFALQNQLGVGTVFAQQVLSFGLLGIEDIGIQIEEPFSVLPLKKICFKISNEAQIVRATSTTSRITQRLARNRSSLRWHEGRCAHTLPHRLQCHGACRIVRLLVALSSAARLLASPFFALS